MQKCVVLNGEIINVGEWEEINEKKYIETSSNGEHIFEDIIINPFPDGAVYEYREIQVTATGRIILGDGSTAYRELRKDEYPSIGDQLDALWKGGEDATEMLQRIMDVKNKYPKSE